MRHIILKLLLYARYRIPRFRRVQYLLESLIVRNSNGWMFSKEIREVYERDYDISIGYGSYGGCFSFKNIPSGVSFGNYCSIAKDIRIFRANHPYNRFTTHPLLYNPVAGFVSKDMLERPRLSVGHDVWIGEWVIILPTVKSIGNGVIIGAGSIVTKDIPPYAIVAGNPAKIIKMRFPAAIIEELEASQWWLWEKSSLLKNIDKLELIARGEA